MPWGRSSDRSEQRRRGDALTSLSMPTHIPIGGGHGSRGGAPIWVMHGEGFGLMAERHKRRAEGGRWGPREGPNVPPYRKALAGGHGKGFPDGPLRPAYEGARGVPHVTDDQAEGDPDGFAVFGRYPKGLLSHVLKLRLLGNVGRADVLHICSGTLGPEEKWTVDVREAARPLIVADGTELPFRADSFRAVMLDPPYSDAYARNLYGVENPRPSWLLTEAARVVRPGGRIGMLHVAIPFAPPDCYLVRVYPVSTGVGFRIRAFTIYEKGQQELALATSPPPRRDSRDGRMGDPMTDDALPKE